VSDNGFEGWAILELMGHRRLAGYLREQEIGGTNMLRIDVPKPDGEGDVATQFYSSAAVYCITPTTEEVARAVARNAQPTPVSRYELAASRPLDDDDDDEEPM
jgi:hypothetical protein